MSISVKIYPSMGSSLVRQPEAVLAPRSASVRRPAARAYAAAVQSRFNGDWKTGPSGINGNLRVLGVVRDKARDLADNDDYGKGFLRQLQTNIIGPYGFSFKINPKNQDEKFRSRARKIEEQFQLWTESEYCTISEDLEFVDVQNLNLKGAGRDGEFCTRILRDKRMKFGFTLQLIPVELLDETYSDTLPGNRIVILGVEYDRTTLKVLAYWFRDVPIEYQIYGTLAGARGRIRIPADQIIHGFDGEYVNQARGISWMVQSMNAMRMLSQYDEATLIAARMRAMIGGFLEKKDGSGNGYDGDDVDDEGNKIVEIENGIFKELPPGYKVSYSDNDFPSAQYDMFINQNLRRQSVGFGVAASVHSGNYSDVNFSSERARQIAVRDNYMTAQQWFIRRFLKPIGKVFMTEAYLSGAIDYPQAQADQFMYHVWSGRRWPYVNPEQEMNANAMKWSLCTKSISEMIREGDGDMEPEEVFAQIQADKKMAEKYGLTITADIKQPTPIIEPGAQPPKSAPQEAPSKKPKKQPSDGEENA